MTIMPTARRLLSGAAAVLMTIAFSTLPATATLTGAEKFRVETLAPPTTLDLAAPDGGQLEDEHCGPGHVPCDDIFEKYCTKVLKGTMSGEQDWGGKTCWTPS